MKKDNKKKVYFGNDCFGRGTFGGGKTDLYQATNLLLQHKQNLSIALFAPGWTYESGGHQSHIIN